MPKLQTVSRAGLWAIIGVLLGVLVAVKLAPSPVDPAPVKVVTKLRKQLKPNENAIVQVKRTRVIEVTRERDAQFYVPPEGRVDVRVKKDGGHEVIIKDKGFTVAPGVGFAVIDAPMLTIDAKLAYWSRWGLVAGVPLSADHWYHPYAAISYQVYNNTSVFLGPTLGGYIIAGARISF